MLQPPSLVNPLPPVKDDELDSMCPITTELVAGVKEATEAAVEPVLLPVDVCKPVVVYPESSSIQTEPATVLPNVAVIVSTPVDAATAYQM